ncbi:MCE family protein [Aerophototrophica crusticola]|uniref:MCE family protein n=1 Tax=Aerophototrophica crusticola TaxID=1709002 RepID=A0A858R7I4_9PROT|nr:MCE family protein [Rhodospirillaceae bacterium B3]
METRASYTLVGAFVLALAAALFVFVVWLARVQLNEDRQAYYINFTGSVTGLVTGSPVRYRGVAVGTVGDIRINPENVEEVRVTVEVPRDTPIKTDAIASLEPVGVTGGVYVEIAGGSQAAPLLREQVSGIPVIKSRPSSIASLLDRAPEVFANLITISSRLSELLDDKNQQSISTLLANLADASAGANATLDNTNKLIVDLRGQLATLGGEAQVLLKTANQTVGSVGKDATAISGELADTTKELKKLTQSLVKTSNELQALIAENREPIRDFTNTGLYDFSQLLVHLQDLAAKLSRVTGRLERDPSELIFGGSEGVEVK